MQEFMFQQVLMIIIGTEIKFCEMWEFMCQQLIIILIIIGTEIQFGTDAWFVHQENWKLRQLKLSAYNVIDLYRGMVLCDQQKLSFLITPFLGEKLYFS